MSGVQHFPGNNVAERQNRTKLLTATGFL